MCNVSFTALESAQTTPNRNGSSMFDEESDRIRTSASAPPHGSRSRPRSCSVLFHRTLQETSDRLTRPRTMRGRKERLREPGRSDTSPRNVSQSGLINANLGSVGLHKSLFMQRWSGGTGRRTGLKIPRTSLCMWVQPPPPAPIDWQPLGAHYRLDR